MKYMSTTWWLGIWWIASIIILGSAGVVHAAQDTPPAPTTPEAVVTLKGRIVNGTPEGTVPPDLTVMVHAWDATGSEQLSLSGVANEDGTFEFADVPLVSGWTYAVMALYQDVAYFSTPFQGSAEEVPEQLEVSIYEATDDPSAIRIERMHVFFDVVQEGVRIAEVYIVSNTGDRTVRDAVTLDDGTTATLLFPLPPGASEVEFNAQVEGEFVRQPGGFADRSPIVPGRAVRQVLVSYLLPYSPNMVYRHTPRYPIKGITALVPSAVGIELRSDALVFAGQQTTSDGVSIDVYTGDNLEPGQELAITLAGTANIRVGNTTGQVTSARARTFPWDVILGGVILVGTLAGVGVWWTRRSRPNSSPDRGAFDVDENLDRFDEVITAIARLDDAHARGEIPDHEYHQQRERLWQKARALAAERLT